MAHLYDRQSPRDLTIPELWASWDIMLDQPSREAKLVQGTLGKDSLPGFALNDENMPSGRKPSTYPIIRTDYDKQSDDTLIGFQNHRSLRLLIIRDIFSLDEDEPAHLPPFMRRRTLKELWELFHETDREKMELPKKLAYAEAIKDKANGQRFVNTTAHRLYKQDDWLEALEHYQTAWCTLLPYHLDAFPAGHAARMLIARMECKIFSNIMATVLEMVKANDHKYSKERKIKLLDIGYRSGMAILGICFAMDVGSLQTTLRRIAQIKSKIDILDTNKTCQAPRKEFRKLHDDLIKYCKDRDPDEKLFLFDYKAPSTKSDLDKMMMMAMMKFMDM